MFKVYFVGLSFLISLVSFEAGATVVSDNKADLLVTTMNEIKDEGAALSLVAPIELTALGSKTLPTGAVGVFADGVSYYYTPSGDDKGLMTALSGTAARHLVADNNGVFEVGGVRYDYDVSAIDASHYYLTELADGESSDFEVVKYVEQSDGSYDAVRYALEFSDFGNPATIETSSLDFKWVVDPVTGFRALEAQTVAGEADVVYNMDKIYGDVSAAEISSLYYAWSLDPVTATLELRMPVDLADSDVIYSFAKNQGDATGDSYRFQWGGDGSGNRRLINCTATPGDCVSASDDIVAVVEALDNVRVVGSAGDINHSFVGLELTGSESFGAAIYSNGGSIGNITGDFIGNYALGTNTKPSYGAAIFNENATIGNISGNFIGNRTEYGSRGGAIGLTSNGANAKIGTINGDFVNNSLFNKSASVYGGALYLWVQDGAYSAEVGDITGDFAGNYAYGSLAYGGAIYNKGTSVGDIDGDFIANYAFATSSSASGGGIYLNESGAEIGNITGDFIGNYAEAVNNTASGGALHMGLYSAPKVESITGDFVGNYAKGTIATGGAIYALSGDIGKITGDFVANYAYGTRWGAQGGAIYKRSNYQALDIEGNFIGNYASGTTAEGGAVYSNGNYNTAHSVVGDFIGNYAKASTSYAIGGAIYGLNSDFAVLSGDYIGNYATSASSYASGGGIYGITDLPSLVGDFIGNYAKGTIATGGGAHFKSANIDYIEGDYIDNYVYATTSYAGGGAIYSFGGSYNAGIDELAADFVGNYAYSESDLSYGGAIYNELSSNGYARFENVSGNFVKNGIMLDDAGNEVVATDFGGAVYTKSVIANGFASMSFFDAHFLENAATTHGGAIYNTNLAADGSRKGTSHLVIGSDAADPNLRSTFEGNTAQYGGAIYNDASLGTITIDADFTSNVANGAAGGSLGGAIYNSASGVITSITGSFIDNYADGTTRDMGGAIYNAGLISEIKDATFSNDVADATNKIYTDLGGAIYNSGTIIVVDSEFDGNTAAIEGAAIHNSGEMEVSDSSFSGNVVKTSGADGYGGAIYNSGTMSVSDTNFTNNSVTLSDILYNAYGGAIYNSGDFTLFADTKDVTITGNTIGVEGSKTNNGIYNSKNLYLNASNSRTIYMNDSISGDGSGKIYLNGAGDVVFNADVVNNTIILNKGQIDLGTSSTVIGGYNQGVDVGSLEATVDNTQIDVLDGIVSEYNFDDFTVTGAKFMIDIDLVAGKSDLFNISGDADIDSSIMLVNVINIDTAMSSGELEVFRVGPTSSVILPDQTVDIVSRDESLSLVHNTSKQGWYNYTADFSASYNLNIAIDEIDSLNTIYVLKKSFANEVVTTKEVKSTTGAGKTMTVNGLDGDGGFVVSSGMAGGAEATLTLIQDSVYNSINVGYDDVNFSMEGDNNEIYFGIDEDVTSLVLNSDFSSANQSNTLVLEGGKYIINGDIDNLSLTADSNLEINGIVSDSIIDASGELVRTNYDYGNKIILGETTKLSYSNWDYLYDSTHGSSADKKLNSVVFDGGSLEFVDGQINDLVFEEVELLDGVTIGLDVDLSGAGSSDMISAGKLTNTSYKIGIDEINIIKDATTNIDTSPLFVTFADDKMAADNLFYLTSDISVSSESDVLGSYLIGDEKINDGQLSFRYANLYTANILDIDTKSYTMTADEDVQADLGKLYGESLAINAGGFAINGAGFEGIDISDGQTLVVSNATTIGSFDGDFVTASGGEIDIASGSGTTTFTNSISGQADVTTSGNVVFDNTSLEAKTVDIDSGVLVLDSSTIEAEVGGSGYLETKGTSNIIGSSVDTDIVVSSGMTLFEDSIINGEVDGTLGSVVIDGTTTFNGDLTATSIENQGVLNMNANLDTGVINNSGAVFNAGADLVLNDTFNGGELNLLSGSTLTFADTDAKLLAESFNAKSGSTVDVKNGVLEAHSFGVSTYDDANIEIDIELNGGQLIGDTFNSLSTGSVKLSSVNIIDSPLQNISGAYGKLDVFTNSASNVFIEGDNYSILTKTYTLVLTSGVNSLDYLLSLTDNSLAKVIASVADPRKYIMSENETAGNEILTGDMSIEGNGHKVTGGTITIDADSSLSVENLSMAANIASQGDNAIVNFNGSEKILFSGTMDDVAANVNVDLVRSKQDTNVDYVVGQAVLTYSDDEFLNGGNSITFNDGGLNLSNGSAGDVLLDNLTINNDISMTVDVDLAKEEMDSLEATNLTINADSKIFINNLNLISDSKDYGTTITNFTENDDLAASVVYTGANQLGKAVAPVYIYDVLYNSGTGDFLFTRENENPQVQAPAVGSLATITINNELYSKVLAEGALVMDVEGMATGDIISRDMNNAWVKVFGSDENLDVKNSAGSVDAYFSGTIVGLDTDLVYEGSCVYANYGVYAAYSNGYMRFDDNKFYQNGYFVGANANLYRDEWFLGLTTSIGMVRSKDKYESSAKFNSYLAGLGIKAGRVYDLGNGFELTPSLYASYMYADSSSYVSPRGAEVDFGNSHNFEVAPELKLEKNLSNNYSTYTKARYVHTFNSSQNVVADGFLLNEVALRPYVEYGLGFEKNKGDWTGFVEVLRKDFGSEGFEAMIGVKWNF